MTKNITVSIVIIFIIIVLIFLLGKKNTTHAPTQQQTELQFSPK